MRQSLSPLHKLDNLNTFHLSLMARMDLITISLKRSVMIIISYASHTDYGGVQRENSFKNDFVRPALSLV